MIWREKIILDIHYQFIRLGYFIKDKNPTADHLIFNRTVDLREGWKNECKDTCTKDFLFESSIIQNYIKWKRLKYTKVKKESPFFR